MKTNEVSPVLYAVRREMVGSERETKIGGCLLIRRWLVKAMAGNSLTWVQTVPTESLK